MKPAADVYAIGDAMPESETLPLYCRACGCEWDTPERVEIPTQRHICPGCGRAGYAVILDDEEAV